MEVCLGENSKLKNKEFFRLSGWISQSLTKGNYEVGLRHFINCQCQKMRISYTILSKRKLSSRILNQGGLLFA